MNKYLGTFLDIDTGEGVNVLGFSGEFATIQYHIGWYTSIPVKLLMKLVDKGNWQRRI